MSSIDAIKWGRNHDKDVLKSFYIQKVMNHPDYKITQCGLFVDKNQPNIAASPDERFSLNVIKVMLLRSKCPLKFKNQFMKEGF